VIDWNGAATVACPDMSSWSDVEADAPELAARAREIFDAHKHKTLATLRRDGSPRISGTEVEFDDGEMWFGSMWKAVKALDLQRDPRFAVHGASGEPPDWTADAKVAGRVEEIGSGAQGSGRRRKRSARTDASLSGRDHGARHHWARGSAGSPRHRVVA
jgi:hypothetical protein